MFFMIWFGTKHRTEKLGVAADNCETCGCMRAFEVIDHFEVGHICSISLTRGTYKGTSRTCSTCHSEVMCYRGDYEEFRPRARAGAMPVEDLAATTNPRLVALRRDRAALEAMAQCAEESASSDDHGNAPMRLAIERIKEVRESADAERVGEFLKRLEAWDSIDGAQRTVLLTEIDTFVKETKQVDQVCRFIWSLGKGFPLNAGCLPALGVIAAVAAAFVFYPVTRSWLWGTLVIVGGVIGTFGVYWKIRSMFVRSWVKRKLIPLGEARGIDFDVFAGILANVDCGDMTIDEPIRDMAQEFETVAGVLLERGKIAMPEQSSILP